MRGERPMRSNEPMFADDTVVTRGEHERVPTIEIPFPDAEHGTTMEQPQPLDTNPNPGNVRQAVPSSAVKPVKPVKRRKRRRSRS